MAERDRPGWTLEGRWRGAVFALAFGLSVAAGAWPGRSAEIDMADSFEEEQLDPNRWDTTQILDYRHWPDAPEAQFGAQAWALRVKAGDGGDGCTSPCERQEIREALDRQLPFAAEA